MGPTAFLAKTFSTFPDALTIEKLRLEYSTSKPRRRIALLKRLQNHYWGVPLEISKLAVEDPHPEVRVWYAGHGDFFGRQGDVEKLQADPEPLVRVVLAANDGASLGFPDEASWKQATELEKLASLQRWHIDERFLLKLFDPDDEELGLTQADRLRYAVVFLAARADKIAKWHRSYEAANMDAPHGLADLEGLAGGKLIELMPKWPANAGIQDFVYRFCAPLGDRKFDVVYRFTENPRWRRLLLENIVSRELIVREVFDLARADPDGMCRELAHTDRSLPWDHWRPGEWRRVLRGATRKVDVWALRGLAKNPTASVRQLRKLLRSIKAIHAPKESFEEERILSNALEECERRLNERRRRQWVGDVDADRLLREAPAAMLWGLVTGIGKYAVGIGAVFSGTLYFLTGSYAVATMTLLLAIWLASCWLSYIWNHLLSELDQQLTNKERMNSQAAEVLSWDDVHDVAKPLAAILRQSGTLPHGFVEDKAGDTADETARRASIEEYRAALKAAKVAKPGNVRREALGRGAKLGRS